MPDPKSIKILSGRWKVVWGKDWDKADELCGLTKQDEKKIYISTNYPEWAQYSTLLHEIIHAIEDELDFELKEKQVRLLEIGLVQVLRENPRFVKELMKMPLEEPEDVN